MSRRRLDGVVSLQRGRPPRERRRLLLELHPEIYGQLVKLANAAGDGKRCEPLVGVVERLIRQESARHAA